MMRLLQNPRLLFPFMMVLGLMVFGLRVNDVWNAASSGRLFAREALAQSSSGAPAAPAISPPSLAASTTPAPAAAATASTPDTAKSPGSDTASAADEDVSPAEMEVLKQLSARREELDKRAKDLDTHEAFLKVAEQRVDQKIKEMETLRTQLQTMVNQVSEGQAAQLDNLVKVYETMKPEDAAKIFETLDMPILLRVVQRMKPKSTAPILAKMAPEKAKDVTVALSKQDQLPQIK
jgi:flagellar motility protein MotE (MotC chaperone)